jgi:protein tyrosine phosphatase (PTP) superfamily phosphohydrolase (DUF442 family)
MFKGLLRRLVNGMAEEYGELEEKAHRPLWPAKSYISVVDEHLHRGSWPSVETLSRLKASGFRTVINLCSERNQDAEVHAAGLEPINIPVRDNTNPTPSQIATFLTTVNTSGPVYVHCEAGKGRTGCMVATYRIKVQGWTPQSALAEALKFGLGMPCQEELILSTR